jgi:MFS family permease
MKTEEQNKFISILIWSCVTLFYCYQYILRPLPNIIMPEILDKYGIGAAEFGSFAGSYYIGYIIVHIPIGILLGRLGAKTVIPICIGCTALSLAPMIYCDSWWLVVLGRIFTGIGSSAAIVGALQIFRILYPTKFTMMLGIMVSLSLITAVYASTLMSGIIASIGMDATISVLLYTGILLAILTYFLLPAPVSEVSHSNIWTDIKAIICNYRLLFASIFAGLMVGPLEGFADAWGSAFIISVYGIEKTVADSITLSVFLGMCVGCLILPYIADKTRCYFGVTIFSGIVMIACFMYILSGKATTDSLYYTCVITGIFCAYQVVIIARIATFVREERSGMAAAVVNMIIMTFGWIFHNSIGMTLDKLWDGTITNGIKSYSATAFITSISIIPTASAIAIIGLTFMSMANVIKAHLNKKNS